MKVRISDVVRILGTDYVSTLRPVGFVECWGARAENGTIVESGNGQDAVLLFVFRDTTEHVVENGTANFALIAFQVEGGSKIGFAVEPIEISPPVEEQIFAALLQELVSEL